MNVFSLSSSPPPEETMLLPPEHGPAQGTYRWGIIGMRDHTLGTLIPPGSVVQIDTQSQIISPVRDWPHELQRPIYFLRSRHAFFCGWCELDVSGERLTLVPHPLSPASNQSWGYPGEVEIVGRVVAVSTPHNVVPSSPAPSTKD
jgi:hypothetical protein